MHPNVLRRIAEADGWIARPTCPPHLIASDRELIAAARASRPAAIRSPSPTRTSRGSRSGARPTRCGRCSRPASATWSATNGRGSTSTSVYMPGTIDEIQAKVQARIDAGVEYLMLHTMSADLEQLELIAKHIIEPFAGVS